MTTRALVIATWLWACGSNTQTELVEGGSLVTIDEGEVRTLHLATDVQLVTPPAWVVLNGRDLVLSPPCDLILGTTGAPVEFELDLTSDRGPTPVVVEVHPSALGTCAPTVVGCVQTVGFGGIQRHRSGSVRRRRSRSGERVRPD